MGPLEWISLGEKHEVSNTFSLFDLVSIVAKEREAEEAKLIEGDVKKLERKVLRVRCAGRSSSRLPTSQSGAHVRDTPLADLRVEHPAKPDPPERDRLMADVDPALGQERSALRSDSAYFPYIITTRRMMSGDLLKYRKGYAPLKPLPGSASIWSDRAAAAAGGQCGAPCRSKLT